MQKEDNNKEKRKKKPTETTTTKFSCLSINKFVNQIKLINVRQE